MTIPTDYRQLDDTHYAKNVVSQNIVTKFRDAFEVYVPSSGDNWLETKASGDIIAVDGNTLGASYLVISKDPLTADTVSTVRMKNVFDVPIEVSIGASMSQRTLGQEFSFEVVNNTQFAASADLAITAIQQAATVLTVTTATPHNLVPGRRIEIFGVADSRFNYPALVVATIVTAVQFTVTGGPVALPSVTAGPFAGGFVRVRDPMSRYTNGTSQIFENTGTTNASFYARSGGVDSLPLGGALTGNHAVAIASTASVQPAVSPYSYSFQPNTEYRVNMQADRLQWSDAAIDTVAQSLNRALRNQLVPSPDENYSLQIVAKTNVSYPVPVGQIVSAVKSGTTTATITMDRAHGLTTVDLVTIYGIRDQAASSFPNLLVATAVASIVNATTFTIVIGTAATVTSYGGTVAKVNGGNLPSACGYNAIVVQSISRTNDELTVNGNTTWAGLVIGDYVNIVGCRDIVTGATLGIDGSYKVANFVTTVLTLVPVGSTPTGQANITLTNAGGAIIKRTDMRISFVRVFDYERQRVEFLPRPGADMSAAIPTVSQGGTIAAVTSAGTPLAPATPYFVNSAASTNGALILTGTSGLCAFYATNIGASAAFVKLYNKATAPTVGTDVPEMIIPVPAAIAGVPGVAELSPGFNAYRFALGLGIAITGAVADADTTSVASGQVKVKLSRTV